MEAGKTFYRLIQGHVLKVLKTIPDESVNLVVTSPPYWGLRDYGSSAITIWDEQEDCEHEWVNTPPPRQRSEKDVKNLESLQASRKGSNYNAQIGNLCSKCSAWRGQLGLEPHPQMYINHLVEVFRECKRVLRKDGSFYLNMGDTYFGGKGKSGSASPDETDARDNTLQKGYQELEIDRPQNIAKQDGKWLQPKQLLLIPSRTTITLQEDGWILRNDIVWHKENHMPSSVTDRLTNSWEHVFHFVKSKKYYYDLDTIRVPLKQVSLERLNRNYISNNKVVNGNFNAEKHRNYAEKVLGKTKHDIAVNRNGSYLDSLHVKPYNYKGKNPSDIYEIGEKIPYAVRERTKLFIEVRNLPDLEKLSKYLNYWRYQRGLTIEEIETRLDSQSPHHWFNAESYPTIEDWRIIKEVLRFDDKYDEMMTNISLKSSEKMDNPKGKNPSDYWEINTQPFKGAHFAVFPEKLVEPMIKSSCPKNGVVLDPFCGSGTTLKVARDLLCSAIGIEVNPEYCKIVKNRVFGKMFIDREVEYSFEVVE